MSYVSDKYLLILTLFIILMDSVQNECIIRTKVDADRDKFSKLVSAESTRLIRLTLQFESHDIPNHREWMNYHPTAWQIATKETGRYIMTSHPDIEFYSLGFFSLGIRTIDIPIVGEPKFCLRNINETKFNETVLKFLFAGLKPTGSQSNGNGSATALPVDTHVCSENAVVNGKTVNFELFCCTSVSACANLYSDDWQYFFFYCIAVLNFIAFLYVANIVPEYLYKDKYGYKVFLYNFDEFATFRVTGGTDENVETDAELELESLKKPMSRGTSTMTSLQDVVQGDQYKVKGVWFRAQDNRLVSKSHLPIGFFIFLYQRLIKCNCYAYRGRSTPPVRLRQLKSVMDTTDGHNNKSVVTKKDEQDFNVKLCCELPICNPKNRFYNPSFPKWSTVLQIIMFILTAVIFAVPWILIYVLDSELPEGKRGQYAQDMKLIYSPPFYAFNLLRFVRNTIPVLSIAWMAIYVICIILVGIILQNDREERGYVGKRIRKTLRDAKDRWDKGVIKSSRVYVTLFLPFKILRNYGILALLLWPIWIVTVCPITILFVLIGNAPTINIFLRLLKLFIIDIVKICRTRGIIKSTKKSFERCVVYLCLILILFIAHFFTFALISLSVNILAYTLAGAIVTANDTFRYTTFTLLIVLNAYDTFLDVEKRYAIFHEKLQAALITRLKDKIKKIAKIPKIAQPNTAFTVPVETDDTIEGERLNLWDNIAISDRSRIVWNARSVIQFLDDDDKIFVSEKFFFEACYMDYYGCPGDFATSLFDATKRVLIIVFFLAFVVFTLNAYGGLAANSASGLLMTLSWGLLPLLINRFFTRPPPELSLDTDDYNFQNKLDEVISKFSEYWEVIDFDVERFNDNGTKCDTSEDCTASFWLKVAPNLSVQLSVVREDDHHDDHEELIPRDSAVNSNDVEMVILKDHEDTVEHVEDKNQL